MPPPKKTDDTVQIEDQIKLFIKKRLDVQLHEQKDEITVLGEEIILLKSSQAFINQKYDDLKLDYDALLKTNKKQKEEINKFSKNSAELAKQANNEAIKLDNVEQYGRHQNLEFKEVPEQDDENTSDISTSHRLSVPSTPK